MAKKTLLRSIKRYYTSAYFKDIHKGAQIEPNSHEVQAQCLALAKSRFAAHHHKLREHGVTIEDVAIILACLIAPNAVKSI